MKAPAKEPESEHEHEERAEGGGGEERERSSQGASERGNNARDASQHVVEQ